jgi:hypothetical protein
MKKYRIVEYADANGERYYEIMIGTSWILGDRWKSYKEYQPGGEFYQTVRYNNLNQARYAVKSMQVKKQIIEEGIIDDRDE